MISNFLRVFVALFCKNKRINSSRSKAFCFVDAKFYPDRPPVGAVAMAKAARSRLENNVSLNLIKSTVLTLFLVHIQLNTKNRRTSRAARLSFLAKTIELKSTILSQKKLIDSEFELKMTEARVLGQVIIFK